MFTSPGSSWSLASQHRRVLAILVGVAAATTNDQPEPGYDKIPAFHLFMYWHQTWRILWRWKLRSTDARSHRCSSADRFGRPVIIWKPGPTTRWCSRSKYNSSILCKEVSCRVCVCEGGFQNDGIKIHIRVVSCKVPLRTSYMVCSAINVKQDHSRQWR